MPLVSSDIDGLGEFTDNNQAKKAEMVWTRVENG